MRANEVSVDANDGEKNQFQYETLDADQIATINEQVVAPVEPSLDYSMLLPAWEADHAGHAALLAAAETDEEKTTHLVAMQTIENAIIDARKKVENE